MSSWVVRQSALVVIVVVGFVVAMTAYFATSTRPPGAPGGFEGLTPRGAPPLYVVSWKEAHFDPWTGEPRGLSYTVNPHGFGATTTVAPVPADMVGRRAIPVPLGFALGVLGAIMLVTLARRRSRGSWARVGRDPSTA